MNYVKIDKSSGILQYDDSKVKWDADIIFNVSNKEILIYKTTRKLTNQERNNIITKIINMYAFGNYFNNEPGILYCKLKNRGLEKKEEIFSKTKTKSYSIIGEEVLELSSNPDDSEIVKILRNVYLNLKILACENKRKRKKNHTAVSSLEFEIFGNRIKSNNLYKIIINIKNEIEDAISNYINYPINIDIIKGRTAKDKTNITFFIKEAN